MNASVPESGSTSIEAPHTSALTGDGLPPLQRRLAIVVIVIGTVMAVLDSSIANVALPTLSRELHADVASTIWIVNAYQVAVTMLLLPFAGLGDVIGYRRVYVLGLIVFTIGSLGCALSSSLLALVLLRVVQGVGAAALMSISPALNRTIFPSNMLGVAVGISALTVASSSAAGPTLGGAILAIAAWPWLFAINVPLGVFASVFALRALPPDHGRGGRFDISSALASGFSLALLVTGLEGFARHLPMAGIAAMLAGSVALAGGFVYRQRALPTPLIHIELFAIPRFSFAALTSLCSFTAQGIAFVALPFLLQGVYGFSPFASGLLFTPWPLAIACVAPLAGRLADRVPAAALSTGGLAVLTLGLGLMAALPAHPGAADIAWRAIVCGLGFGFFQAPNNREILGSAPRERSGSAAGILGTARLTGQSLGAALVAIVIGTAAGAAAHGAGIALAAPSHLALRLASGVAAFATCVSALRLTTFSGLRGQTSGSSPLT